MTDNDPDLAVCEPPKVLVPVEVLEGQTVPPALTAFLAPADVVVLGYHVLPEQTPTEQASMQYEERAQRAVEEIAATFRESGGDAEARVAFTHDRDRTVDRIAEDVGATAIALPNPSAEIEDVLVPLRGAIDVSRLADLVATLFADSEGTVTLWGVSGQAGAAAEGGETFDAEAAIERASERLRERGVADESIRTETTESGNAVDDIVRRTAEFDAVVMGEGDAGLLSVVFGDAAERVAEGAVAPVVVVRSGPGAE